MTDDENKLRRDVWLPQLREIFGGRFVRWAHPVGDYDGRERTLDVFNADAHDQLDLLKRFRQIRSDVEHALGGPVIVIFHTTVETERLYADVKRVCAWCGPHALARFEGRPSDHTRCDDFSCGCHCQDGRSVN